MITCKCGDLELDAGIQAVQLDDGSTHRRDAPCLRDRHCPTCQCNKLNPELPKLGDKPNPLQRSWHS